MGQHFFLWFAVAGGIVAAACAVGCAAACAWISRAATQAATQSAPAQARGASVGQVPMALVQVAAAQHAAPPPGSPQYVTHAPPDGAQPRTGVVLDGNYPGLGRVLGGWMQGEPDAIERVRIAQDLGRLGGADSARALLDGVRTGVINPTVAADNLARGGFEAGIAVAAALRDPEPRVRSLATTLVGRCTPLERTAPLLSAGSPFRQRPMPEPPTPPGPT
ncbi:MAG: hypothetical protein JWM98_1045 [Thermoleophilia bacterium]|nr:hypothetical protein [Thermoleophilia bacterium]